MSENEGVFTPDRQNDSRFKYTIIPNELLRDQSISPNCRWLICYLASNADNWVIKIRQIINHCKGFIGRDQIYSILNEAIEAGYIKREESSYKGMRRIQYLISTEKKFKKCLLRPENQDVAGQDTAKPDDKELPSSTHYQVKEDNPIVPKRDAVPGEGKKAFKKKEESSVEEEKLSEAVLQEIKSKNTDFSRTISATWKKDCGKLLKIREASRILFILRWALDDDFWWNKVLSPAKILKHLDSIEMQITKKEGKSWKCQTKSSDCNATSSGRSTQGPTLVPVGSVWNMHES